MQTTAYFDTNGRCIPNGISSEHHVETRRYFTFEQPTIDYDAIHTRLVSHLKIDQAIPSEDFAKRAENILDKLRDNPACSNILNGVHVPFMLPKQAGQDIGTQLDQQYINAVKTAFEETFADNTFTNQYKDGLAGKLSIALDSRHEHLITAQSKEMIVGYFFPCLMEYSIPAAIEQTASLPEQFLLAGGYDTSAALIGSPDLLLRKDGYPPVLWMTALDTEKSGVGYHYEAYGYNLTFNRKPHFDRVAESWASGLVVLG